jgi:hypothetical protein
MSRFLTLVSAIIVAEIIEHSVEFAFAELKRRWLRHKRRKVNGNSL